MKIIAIVGSVRKDSYNKKLAEFMKERYAGKLDIEVFTLENIPMFNEDIELEPNEVITDFREMIKSSDGLLFVTPEYNHSIPGVLKNVLDWSSRVERVMLDKPAMIVGASMGALGTVKSQMHLRQVLNSGGVSALTMPGNEVLISTVQDKFDNGNFNDESTIQFLDKTVDNFIKWINKVS